MPWRADDFLIFDVKAEIKLIFGKRRAASFNTPLFSSNSLLFIPAKAKMIQMEYQNSIILQLAKLV